MRRLVLLVLICLSSSACNPRPVAEAELTFVERVLNAHPDDELPCIIGIHGLGDTPERFLELFIGLDVPVRIIAPRAPDPWTEGTSWFPLDMRNGPAQVLARAELLVQLSERVRATRPTTGLPIVTGFSQGGILSYALSAYHPQHFASAFPLNGFLFENMPPYHQAPKGFRVTAFHGEQDERIPYAGALRTVKQLHEVGTDASVTGLPGVGHTLPPDLIMRWQGLLREQLKKPFTR